MTLQDIIKMIIEPGWIQWGAFITSILYVFLAAKQNPSCWMWGIISVILTYIVCYESHLYSDALLQVFYFFLSIYGWIQWRKGSDHHKLVDIRNADIKMHLYGIGGSILAAFILGKGLALIGASLPYWDALITAFSIFTTWMAARRYIENWIYWLVINIAYICLFLYKEIYLFVLLYAIFAVLSVYGWKHWKREKAGLNPGREKLS